MNREYEVAKAKQEYEKCKSSYIKTFISATKKLTRLELNYNQAWIDSIEELEKKTFKEFTLIEGHYGENLYEVSIDNSYKIERFTLDFYMNENLVDTHHIEIFSMSAILKELSKLQIYTYNQSATASAEAFKRFWTW